MASADVIAKTEIVDIRSRWQRGLVVSTVFAEVTACVQGRCPNEVVSFEVMGGEIDGVVQVISGSRVPQVGDRCVLLVVTAVNLGRRSVEIVEMLPIVEGRSQRRWVEVDGEMVEVSDLPRLASRVDE